MADTLNSIVDRSISEFEDDKIKRVGKNAFRGCEELSSVTLPSVRAIGDKAFKDCTSLEDITVGDNYDGVVSVNDDSFDGCNPINVIVPKDKVDLYKKSDSWSGFVGTKNSKLTVNWGRCGTDEDVVVEYTLGEGIWVPTEFLLSGFEINDNSSGAYYKAKTTYASSDTVGYIGATYYNDYCGIAVYKLPQELGKYLYENAENSTNSSYGRTRTDSNSFYCGIGLYPDDADDWTVSYEWGVGIRKKNDLSVYGFQSNGIKLEQYDMKSHSSYSTIRGIMSDDSYYMVAQFLNNHATFGLGVYLHGWEDKTLYFKHWKDMPSTPTKQSQGAKYTTPSELCTSYPIPDPSKSGTQGSIYGMKDSFTVNWGKDSSGNDIITTFKRGDNPYIPIAFLKTALNSDGSINTKSITLSSEVGYKGTTTISQTICVFKLPQLMGKWLYENAEDNLGKGSSSTHADYSSSSNYNNAQSNNYKGIAIYPDTPTSWNSTEEWGVGIRMKSDIDVVGYVRGSLSRSATSILSQLEDDAYYLVAQYSSYSSDRCLGYQLKTPFSGIDDTGSDHLWLRHYNTMTSAPSATNMGKKYTLDNSLFKSLTLPLTVNWGKCGGTEDVIVNYDKDEGLWIPKEFLEAGFNATTLVANPDKLFLEDGVTKDTSVGYKTWFSEYDYVGHKHNGDVRYDAFNHSGLSPYYICVYKLPQALGEYLYNNAETHINGVSDYVGKDGLSYVYKYKGIAIYPDATKDTNDWTRGFSYSDGGCGSKSWGVGIRKKSDITTIGLDPTTLEETKKIGDDDYSRIETYDEWKALEDDAYYLVSQVTKTDNSNTLCAGMGGYLPLFKDNTIYFRHWNTLTVMPTSDTSTHGKKYDVPLSLPPDDAKPLGGKIFYIDPNDNGATYTFYDESGKKISGTTASELASAKYYVKSGTSTSDKVYVYYPESYSNLQWGFYNIETTSNYNTDIGGGKENTSSILSRTDIESDSIWAKLIEVREETGIEDLYIPSISEVEACRGIYPFVDGKNCFWSSTAGTYVGTGTHVLTTAKCYQTQAYGGTRNGKDSNMYVFFIHSL